MHIKWQGSWYIYNTLITHNWNTNTQRSGVNEQEESMQLVFPGDVSEQSRHGLSIVDPPDGFTQYGTDVNGFYLVATLGLSVGGEGIGDYDLADNEEQ